MSDVASLFAALQPELPRPGGGQTAERFRQLWAFATVAPSLGRLAEAHFDATAILREAGRQPLVGARYAVWAAGGPVPATLQATGGSWRLTGRKHWCSGATLATHALVTARHGSTNALVLVTLDQRGVEPAPPVWNSPAFAVIDTRTVDFDVLIGADDIIASDDWYLTRPGFWHGAVGVASCWAGCAAGLIDRLLASWPEDPHASAHLGAIDAAVWTMRAAIATAGCEIDRATDQGNDDGRRRALRVRHIVDHLVADVTTRAMRAVGPGSLAHQPLLHTMFAETDLYRRQCHAERDLDELGAIVRAEGAVT